MVDAAAFFDFILGTVSKDTGGSSETSKESKESAVTFPKCFDPSVKPGSEFIYGAPPAGFLGIGKISIVWVPVEESGANHTVTAGFEATSKHHGEVE